MNIAIHATPLVAPLLVNIDAVAERLGWRILRCRSDAECSRLLHAYSADLALVSPQGYGDGVGTVDYRLIPGPAVMLHGYTNVTGLTFREGTSTIATVASPEPDDFGTVVGAVLLREKFDVDVHVTPGTEADCVIATMGPGQRSAMDVSEEYDDLTEAPLPMAVWACRVEAELDMVADAVAAFADPTVTEREVSEMLPPGAAGHPREGRITYRWTDETEEALATILDLLFYHQVLPEIPAVKLLGRDDAPY